MQKVVIYMKKMAKKVFYSDSQLKEDSKPIKGYEKIKS